MCKWQKMILRPQRSPRYRIVHGWKKNEYGSSSWSPWKILKQLENRERLLLLFFSLLFFPFSSLFFFDQCEVLLIFLFSPLILFIHFFIFPRTLICIVTTSSPILRCLFIPKQRGSGVKVGVECLDERELESSLWSTFLWRVVSILKWKVGQGG
jgi:hypothetical protein